MSANSIWSITAQAQELWVQLVLQVAQAEETGRPVPCRVDPGPYVDDKTPGSRAEAAEACRRACPALAACSDYADAAGETWLVWGGEDRKPPRHTGPRSRVEAVDKAAPRGGGDPLPPGETGTAGEGCLRSVETQQFRAEGR